MVLPLAGEGAGKHFRKVSFRDKLLGSHESFPRREKVDLFKTKQFRVELEDGDRLRPKCFCDEEFIQEPRKPWKDAVLVKLLGTTISFFTLGDLLKALWKSAGDFKMVDIGHGFQMIKFDLLVDREKVINDGPWMVFDHVLAIREWSPDFISSSISIDCTWYASGFHSLGWNTMMRVCSWP